MDYSFKYSQSAHVHAVQPSFHERPQKKTAILLTSAAAESRNYQNFILSAYAAYLLQMFFKWAEAPACASSCC